METNGNNWGLGELVTLPREERILKKSGTTEYMHIIGSRYICIREATNKQRGILMRVLGKANGDRITIENGKPFCKDDHEELFYGSRYFSYPFPSASQITEALDILRANQDLQQKFEKASMHLNPDSTFWVSDTTRNVILRKIAQFVNGHDGQLYPANDNEHYRITFVYFYKGNLNW